MTNSLLLAPGLPSVAPGTSYSNTLQGSWVQDSAGNVWWLETSTDTDGSVTFIYYDQPGGVVGVPTGNVEPIQDSNIQAIKRGDDVNGDGSTIVIFFRVNVYDEDGAILTSNPQNASGGVYTILGTEIDPQDEVEAILDNIGTNTAATAASADNIDTRVAGSFINFNFDEVTITRVAAGAAQGEIETAVYKSATVTVATLTITYDGNGDLSGVVRS